MPRLHLDLTLEQQAEAARIKHHLLAAVDEELQGIAELLASKPDGQLLGPTESQVRGRALKNGAKAIGAAKKERKGGLPGAQAPVTRHPV